MYMAHVAQDLNKAYFIAAVKDIKVYFFFMEVATLGLLLLIVMISW